MLVKVYLRVQVLLHSRIIFIGSASRLWARASMLYVRFWFPLHLVLVHGYWFVLLYYILGSGSRFVLLDHISHLVVKCLVMKLN